MIENYKLYGKNKIATFGRDVNNNRLMMYLYMLITRKSRAAILSIVSQKNILPIGL